MSKKKNKNATSIGQELENLLSEKNMTAEQIARKVQMPERYIKLIIAGKMIPKIGDLVRISKGLGVSSSKLEFKEGNEEKHTYAERRRIGLIITSIFSRKKCSMEWTSFFGKEKSSTFNYYGGLIISW